MGKLKVVLIVVVLGLAGGGAYVYFLGMPSFLGGGTEGPKIVHKSIQVNMPGEVVLALESAPEAAALSGTEEVPAITTTTEGQVKAAPVEVAKPVPPAAPKPKAVEPAKSIPSGSEFDAPKEFAINIASFQDKQQALDLNKKIKGLGYRSYVTTFKKDGISWFRVRVGFYSSRAEAESIGNTIGAKVNIEGSWVIKASKKEIKQVMSR